MNVNPHDIRITDRLRELVVAKVEELTESIREIGLLNPITVSRDLTLIAGNHRLAACKALGYEQIAVHVVDLNDLRRELAEIDENLMGPSLSALERGEHLIRRKEIYETLHPQTRHGATGRNHLRDPDSGSLSFVDDTAAKTERSRSTVAEDIRIANRIAPALRDQLRGTDTARSKSDLAAIAALDGDEQAAVVAKIGSGEAKSARDAVYQLRKEERRIVTLDESVHGRFPVILADPPWQYSNTGLGGNVADKYPTMDTDAICAMPVAEKSTTNAVLFLWATNPLLEDALRVVKAWGFEYKTNIAWTKTTQTTGFYCYGRHELLLICVRGAALPKPGSIGASHVHAATDEHSKKPDEFYALIERMYDGPYLELFGRRPRQGWTTFGNEQAVNAA